MSNWLKDQTDEKLFGFLFAGWSVRKIAKELGISKVTVQKRRSVALEGMPDWMPDKCACGGLPGHRGWCGERFKHSEARQNFMKKWHERTK